jgi:hypothetical protein
VAVNIPQTRQFVKASGGVGDQMDIQPDGSFSKIEASQVDRCPIGVLSLNETVAVTR